MNLKRWLWNTQSIVTYLRAYFFDYLQNVAKFAKSWFLISTFKADRYLQVFLQKYCQLKKIQDISLVFRNFVFTFVYFQFCPKQKCGCWFLSTNSRFHWFFQDADLTLFSFLEENYHIGWGTYKSTAHTESNK